MVVVVRTLEIVQQEIADIRAAIALGAERIKTDLPNGSARDTTYRSLKELREILAFLLGEEAAFFPAEPRLKSIYFQTSKGL